MCICVYEPPDTHPCFGFYGLVMVVHFQEVSKTGFDFIEFTASQEQTERCRFYLGISHLILFPNQP